MDHTDTEAVEPQPTGGKPPLGTILLVLAALAAVYAIQRLWLINSSPTIAEDGMHYVHLARRLDRNPEATIRKYRRDEWGYPAAMLTAARLFGGASAGDREPLETAGTVLSFAFGLAALVGSWFLALKLFESTAVATVGTLLFCVGQKFAAVGADVLSDAPALCFGIWALVAAVIAGDHIRAGARRAAAGAATAGILAGIGFLFRMETAVVLPVALALWLVIRVWRGGTWTALGCGAAAATAGFALVTGPYVWMTASIGGTVNLPLISAAPDMPFLLAETLYPVGNPALELLGKYFEAQHPVGASLACAWLVSVALLSLVRRPVLQNNVVRITDRGGVLLFVLWLLVVPPIILHYLRTGALSHRYLFLPAAAMAGAAGAGLAGICRAGESFLAARGAKRAARFLLPAVTAILAALVLIDGCDPLHAGTVPERKAGEYLAERAGEQTRLFTDSKVIRYYSGMPRERTTTLRGRYFVALRKGEKSRIEILAAYLADDHGTFDYCAVYAKTGDGGNTAEIHDLFSAAGYRETIRFPNERGDDAVLIFQKHPS